MCKAQVILYCLTILQQYASSPSECLLRQQLATTTQRAIRLLTASGCLRLLSHLYCKSLLHLDKTAELETAALRPPHWQAWGKPLSSPFPVGLISRASDNEHLQGMKAGKERQEVCGSLLKYQCRHGTVYHCYHTYAAIGEQHSLTDLLQVMQSSFRSLCTLLWYLHCREQASLHIRKLFNFSSEPQVS